MPEISNVPCGVCGSSRSEQTFVGDFRHFGHGEPLVMRTCSGCGLLFQSPRPSERELLSLYSGEYYVFNKPARTEVRRMTDVVRRTVSLLADQGRRQVLDIGAGRGYLLGVLRELNWVVTGVEPSPQAAIFARTRLHLDVHTGTLEGSELPAMSRFGVVLAIDVLEHVPDPRRFIRAVKSCLAPGGYVILDTPNGGARNIDEVGIRWRGFNPFHVYLFNARNLSSLMESEGFRVEVIGSYNEVSPEMSVNQGSPQAGTAGVSRGPGHALNAANGKARLRTVARGARRALRDGLGRLELVAEPLLLPLYLWRAAALCRRAQPVALDPAARGDNLVCIAKLAG